MIVGGREGIPRIDSAEVVDFLSPYSVCDKIPSFPIIFDGAVGGLGFRNEPLVCPGTYFYFS